MKYSDRLIFLKGKQTKFINFIKRSSGLSWKELAKSCGSSITRLSNELRYEKYSIPYFTFKKLCKLGKLEEKNFLKDVKEVKYKNWGK